MLDTVSILFSIYSYGYSLNCIRKYVYYGKNNLNQ
jgi:hypothetical protein